MIKPAGDQEAASCDAGAFGVARASEQRFQVEALRSIGEQLRQCLALATSDPSAANVDLATIARDHAAMLILGHDPAVAQHLFLERPDSPFTALFVDGALVGVLLNLPAPACRVTAAWQRMDRGDERRFLAGLLFRLPQDLDGLGDRLRDERYAALLIQYVAWQPKCFATEAERRRYYDYAVTFCALCAELLDQAPPPALLRLLLHVVGSLRSGTIYSCDGTLIAFAKAKARLIEAFVRTIFGAPVAGGRRPDLLPGNAPIHLGLLWNDVDRRTENVVGVASTRSLRDHGFRVTSILHHKSYHGGDADRATVLDDISALSDDLVDLDDLSSPIDKSAAIKALDLDCLLFMNNVTFGYNEYVALAAMRLARWQAVNFCAVFTTGFANIDLYFSGAMSERSASPDEGYTERLVRLPGSCLIFDRGSQQAAVRNRGIADALREVGTRTLFASGANLYKIHPELSDSWARVLEATPGSRLVLYPFNPNWDLSYPVNKFLRRFEWQLLRRGIDPERVSIAGPWRNAEAIDEVLAAADVYLDSFPHSGGLSSLDALRLGLPVVTLQGETQRQNQSADLLDLLGLSGFVSTSVDGYVAQAARLARDPDYWASYRVAILRSMPTAPFFDTERYARVFAACLRKVLVNG